MIQFKKIVKLNYCHAPRLIVILFVENLDGEFFASTYPLL